MSAYGEAFIAERFKASDDARTAGDITSASEELRKLLLRDPSNAKGWHLYAMRLTEAREYGAAFEALKNALEVNPLNLDVMEVFLDAAFGRPERAAAVDRALDAMIAALPGSSKHHRRALDVLVPARRTAAIPVLVDSPDRVTRAVAGFWAAENEFADAQPITAGGVADRPSWLTEDEFLVAQMLYSLQRGRRSRAIALVKLLPPQAVSRWSLRQAIRRDLRKNQLKGARRLLSLDPPMRVSGSSRA
ncbi:tetratricopeptide repeat protein [Kocuria salsicia]|uniref:tetratricopeptide repeat protein n=1 Tax=Kocuria salsicia TaxID=664639 RepID=UPI00119EE079|nr:hypothetical protein [Kocuria salsicia]